MCPLRTTNMSSAIFKRAICFAVSRSDDETIDGVLQERFVENVALHGSFWIRGRYNIHVALHSISCARTSISIYDELILTEREMIATARRKHDNRVHLE